MVNPLDNSLQVSFSKSGSQLDRLKEAYLRPGDREHKKLKKAAQEFEAVFVNQLLDAMDKTVQRDGYLNGGHAEEMFRGMMNEQIAIGMSTRPGGSGFGLAETIYKQMSQAMTSQPNQVGQTSQVNKQG